MRADIKRRFWAKVSVTKGCWQWIANRSQSGSGYGALFVNGRLQGAHRISWEIHFGKIPDFKNVLHTCDNKGCVNPRHLFIGTTSENMLDAAAKGRLWNQKLTALDIADIRAARQAGEPSSVTAKRLGIHEGHVRKIAIRKAGNYVP